jgi:hypothetical protein
VTFSIAFICDSFLVTWSVSNVLSVVYGVCSVHEMRKLSYADYSSEGEYGLSFVSGRNFQSVPRVEVGSPGI